MGAIHLFFSPPLLSVSLCLSLSVCLSMSVSLSPSLSSFLSLHLFIYKYKPDLYLLFSLCLSLCFCLSVSVSVSVCLSVCLSVSVSLSLSVCLCLSVCLSVCLSLSSHLFIYKYKPDFVFSGASRIAILIVSAEAAKEICCGEGPPLIYGHAQERLQMSSFDWVAVDIRFFIYI